MTVSLAAISNALADTTGDGGRVVYEWARLRDAADPQWLGFGVAAAVAVLAGLVLYLYRRDTRELPFGLRLLLSALRLVALAGLVVFFLGLEKRTAREVVTDSQVVVLADVSQSMGLGDGDASGVPAGPSRGERLATALAESPLLDELRERNGVVVARFDQEVDRLLTLEKVGESEGRRVKDPRVDASGTSTLDSRPSDPDWRELLLPRGSETRVGDAIREQLEAYRDAPLAGIVLVSDGVQNAGLDAAAAAGAAKEAGVPVFTIGMGSTEPPRSIAVADVVAPRRAFPGDSLTATAYLQSNGFAGNLVDVQLAYRDAADSAAAPIAVDSQRVMLAADGELVPVRFEFAPPEPGRFVYELTVAPLVGDANTRDNRREAEIDVVEQRTRVLLMAGGPARDYRFLRTLLYRDATMQVDVLLQSAGEGISQEADQILTEFPAARDELFQYDCLVAIDPDWMQLDAADIELLDSWVGNEAGGMIVVAGPVHTATWIRSAEHGGLRALYPVDFQQRLTLLDDGHYSGETAWPLEFERAGREAEFLWLEDTADASQAAWQSFDGVFGCYAVRGAKPGATVYARFSDPEVAFSREAPVYFAGHFYGAGRVFYAGSAEFWRLRMVEPTYLDTLWTKLIRHVSQGRLLRGSSRGSLLVERDRYELGEPVAVRARFTDASYQPLVTGEVTAQVLRPDGIGETVRLVPDVNEPGAYTGQFHAMQEGAYEIAVAVPDRADEQLTRRIQVRTADRERLNPVRNEPLLAALAETTGGAYYPQLETAVYGAPDVPKLAAQVPDRTETRVIQGAPDGDFARRHRELLLGMICGALVIEWTIRRLCRLA